MMKHVFLFLLVSMSALAGDVRLPESSYQNYLGEKCYGGAFSQHTAKDDSDTSIQMTVGLTEYLLGNAFWGELASQPGYYSHAPTDRRLKIALIAFSLLDGSGRFFLAGDCKGKLGIDDAIFAPAMALYDGIAENITNKTYRERLEESMAKEAAKNRGASARK